MITNRTPIGKALRLFTGHEHPERGFYRQIVWMILVLLLCLLLSGCGGSGGVFTVNNNGDAGDNNPGDGQCRISALTSQCTLRAALEEANALAGANTVNFNLPAGSLTIRPLTALPVLTDNVTIDATTQPGYVVDPIVIVDGTLDRPPDAYGLKIASGVTATLRGLQIQRFLFHGIFNQGTLRLENMILGQNDGCGLFSYSDPGLITATIVSSDFMENTGAGICATNTDLDMSNDEVAGNDFQGIGLTGGDLIMDNSRVTGNSSMMSEGGGMVLHVRTYAGLTDVVISGNSTNDAGGGIFFSGAPGSSLAVVNSTISDNEATLGGGIYIEGGRVGLSNTVLTDNRARADGGGVMLKNNRAVETTLQIMNGTAIGQAGHGNIADSDSDGSGLGGGIFSESQIQMADSTVEANTGDGIYSDGGEIVIQDSTVQTNTANGIKASIATVMGVRIDRSDVSGNDLTGINLTNANLTMDSDTVMDNRQGGIFINGGQIYLNDSTVADNSTEQNGGGIAGLNLIYASIIRVAIWGNSADREGGGIWLDGSVGSLLELANITIHGNRAGVSGGGLQAESGRVELNNMTITQNAAPSAGGMDSLTTALYISNSIVAQNTGGNCQGTITSMGSNLDDDSTCSLTGPGDLSGIGIVLGPMQDNGGPTFTRAIFSPGPATDAAKDATCEGNDQRGVVRPQGVHCDKGAYELEVAGMPTPVETAVTPTETSTVTAITPTPTAALPAATYTRTNTRPAAPFTPTATITRPAATYTSTPTQTRTSANYQLEYLSGSGQTYGGGGMPLPMVFKIKNTVTNAYVNQPLAALDLSMVASASVGYQDAEFNNLNNYNGQGAEAFGGYYYVPSNSGPAYTLQITVTLSLNGVPVGSYLITENITGKTPTFTPTPTQTLTPVPMQISFKPVEYSSTLIYHGGKTCKDKQLTIKVQILPFENVKSAGVFFRLEDKQGGQIGDWSQGFAMTPLGSGWFQYTLSADEIPGVQNWQVDAWLAVQFVANNQNGQKLANSAIRRDVTVSLCQR